MWQNSYDNSPSVYLVPTPIGNLDDITFRAINILKTVNVIYSEDTRVTLNLLNYFKINNKLLSLHDHNEDKVKDRILEYLKSGQSVAIVSDRGTPIISDPGYKTVNYIIDNGYNVIALPGACAFVPALISSGLNSEHFLFYGFLNSNENKKIKELKNLSSYEYTMIFYEAPHRIKKTLNILYKVFGDRNISLSREISKKFESIYRGKISSILLKNDEIKGEIVLLVEGNYEEIDISNISINDSINKYIANGHSTMESIKMVARERHLSKSEVYKEYQGGK